MKHFTLIISFLCMSLMSYGAVYVNHPFSPTDISGLGLWLDASDNATMYDSVEGGNLSTNNGVVARWVDKSGNGNNANVFTGSPRFTSSGMYFTNSAMSGVTNVSYTSTSIFIVFNVPTIRSCYVFVTGGVPGGGSSGGGQSALELNRSGYDYLFSTGINWYFPIESTTGDKIYSYTGVRPSNVSFYSRGVFIKTSALTAVTPSGVYTVGSFGFNRFNGHIKDFIVYNRVLTTSERQLVEKYLSAKWAIPLSGKVNPEDYPTSAQPTIITSAYSQPLLDDASLTNGLVLRYSMDESSWNGTAGEVRDSISTNHGTAFGGAQTNPGKFNRAGYFDGVNDYVSIGAVNNLTSTVYTISTWIYPVATLAVGVCGYSDSNGWRSAVSLSGGTVVGIYNTGSDNSARATTSTVPTLVWSHIVVSHSNGTVFIYKNGIQQTLGAVIPLAAGLPSTAYIGRNVNPAAQNFNGQIDDLRIYNRALSSNEVPRLYNATRIDHKPKAVYVGKRLIYNPRKLNYSTTAP